MSEETEIKQLRDQVNEIHRAIIGDALGNKGLLHRIEAVETKQCAVAAKLTWSMGFLAALVVVWEALKHRFLG